MTTIKENWEKVDEVCSQCGQITLRQRGITRQNIKRLFSFKMNYTEFLITFMLILILVMAYAYMSETKLSKEWIKQMYAGNKSNCLLVCDNKCTLLEKQEQENNPNYLNFSFDTNG